MKAATSRATEGLTRALERAGHVVDRVSEGAPMVFATLPAGLVKQFSERADVEVAYLAQDEEYEDHMNVAGPSIKADALWDLGVTGAGSRIAIIEDSRVDFGNSCLPRNNNSARACLTIRMLTITRPHVPASLPAQTADSAVSRRAPVSTAPTS